MHIFLKWIKCLQHIIPNNIAFAELQLLFLSETYLVLIIISKYISNAHACTRPLTHTHTQCIHMRTHKHTYAYVLTFPPSPSPINIHTHTHTHTHTPVDYVLLLSLFHLRSTQTARLYTHTHTHTHTYTHTHTHTHIIIIIIIQDMATQPLFCEQNNIQCHWYQIFYISYINIFSQHKKETCLKEPLKSLPAKEMNAFSTYKSEPHCKIAVSHCKQRNYFFFKLAFCLLLALRVLRVLL